MNGTEIEEILFQVCRWMPSCLSGEARSINRPGVARIHMSAWMFRDPDFI